MKLSFVGSNTLTSIMVKFSNGDRPSPEKDITDEIVDNDKFNYKADSKKPCFSIIILNINFYFDIYLDFRVNIWLLKTPSSCLDSTGLGLSGT